MGVTSMKLKRPDKITKHYFPPSREAFRPKEWAIIQKCRTPRQVHEWLRSLPYNWEKKGETLRTFRGVVRHWEVHCLEGALTAATILEQHGYPPLLLDLESQPPPGSCLGSGSTFGDGLVTDEALVGRGRAGRHFLIAIRAAGDAQRLENLSRRLDPSHLP